MHRSRRKRFRPLRRLNYRATRRRSRLKSIVLFKNGTALGPSWFHDLRHRKLSLYGMYPQHVRRKS
jgi:hypothetical protein